MVAPISMSRDEMKAKIFALGIAALFVVSVFSTVAEAKARPAFSDDEQGNKWVLKNDQINVWFQGKKPMLKVFRNGENGDESGYMLKIQEIFEKDKSGSTAAVINLEQARPQDWHLSTDQGDDSLTQTMSAAISQPGANGGSCEVTFVFHIDTTSSEVKFDMVIEDWVWKSADKDSATLALKLLVVDEKLEQKAGNEVAVGDEGYVKWASTARVGGDDVDVTHVIGSEGDTTHLILTYQNSGNASRLEYDPTIGVTKASTGGSTITIGIVGVVVIVAVMAVIMIRRRK
jgi:hypothetical protein